MALSDKARSAAFANYTPGSPDDIRRCFDERANEAQREALFYVLPDQARPVGTVYEIFSANIETIKDRLSAQIEFEWDPEKRRTRVELDNGQRA